MRFLPQTATALVLLASVGCSSSTESGNSHTGTQADDIINGNVDTTRQAVVAVLSNSSLCSGTIVSKDVSSGIGYVLTAAHCVSSSSPPVEIRQGNNFANPTRAYSVVAYQAHPAYGGGDPRYDIGMIRIAGVDASTPTIDIGNATSVTNGMQVMSVGYGITGPVDNTIRYNILKNLNAVQSSIVSYSLSGGGICSGDSGGPMLTPGSSQVVIAVHSSVDNATSTNCSGNGYSVRVSAHFDSFIKPFMDEQVAQTCDLCQQVAQSGSCSGAIDACFNNTSCANLVDCLNNCPSGDSACYQGCANTNSAGLPLYNAIFDCTCTACDTECASECAGPTCGFQFQDDTCTTCHEANCCQEGADCADNSECTTCVTATSPAASCDSNQQRTDWFTCLEQNCATECGFGSGGSGGTGGSGGSAGSAGSGGSTAGSGGSGAQGGSAQGGAGATGGSAQGGSEQGGSAQGGSAQGGSGAQGGDAGSAQGGSSNLNDGDSGSSATCTLSIANSGSGTPVTAGLMLLGLLGLTIRRRK